MVLSIIFRKFHVLLVCFVFEEKPLIPVSLSPRGRTLPKSRKPNFANINVLLAHSEILAAKVAVLRINGLLAHLFKACTADVLDLNRIASIVSGDRYQWRLVS